jgi:uncharacterized protein YoxC
MLKFRHSLLAAAICAALFVPCAWAQTNLTEILDSITNPDGTRFNGTVVITWNGFAGTTSAPVSHLSASASIYNGALSVLLVPTTTAAAGTYYQVVYNSSNGTVTWSETWQVPPSTIPLTISQVRQSTGPGSGGSGGGTGGGITLPIPISQVTGLSGSLSAINSSLSSLTTQLNTLGSTVGGHTTSLTNLTSMVNGLSTTVSGNTTSLTTLNNSVTALTTTVNSNAASLTTLTTTVGSLNTSLTNLSNLVNGLAATVNALSNSGSTAVFVDAETPVGTINGTNAAFTLAHTPAPAASLSLYRNGLEQTNGIDFTLNGAALTFVSGSIPQTSDFLAAYYRMAGTGTPAIFADAETPGGTINGTNLTFTLAFAPSPVASLKLYKNGVLLIQATDYSVSSSTITFANVGATPQAGDTLLASYRH